MDATPPIEFGVPTEELTERFRIGGAVPDAVIDRLAAICRSSRDATQLAEHSRDWWPLAMHWALRGAVPAFPAIVMHPSSTSDVAAIAAVCHEHRVPLTASGGRSGVSGGAVPAKGGVVIDMTSLHGVVDVDATSGVVHVRPGTFGPDLESTLANHGLSVGHFPQSFELSTVGGWIAARGAGQYSTRYGKIDDMVVALEVVLADGRVIRTGGAPAGADGPDLVSLFVGSEGTLGIITDVWLRAHPRATSTTHAAYSLDSMEVGIEACRRIVRDGATPAVMRLYDAIESKRSHGGDGTRCTLLVLDEGDDELTRATMAVVHRHVLALGARIEDTALVDHWLEHRNDTSGLQALTHKGYVIDTMEVAGPWSSLPGIYTAVREAMSKVPDSRSVSAHLSHSYLDGACLYFTFAGDKVEDPEALYRTLWDAGQRAALSAGANLSHHHGVGLNRSRFVREALGSSFEVLAAIKASLDPLGILNPGKLGLGDSDPWP